METYTSATRCVHAANGLGFLTVSGKIKPVQQKPILGACWKWTWFFNSFRQNKGKTWKPILGAFWKWTWFFFSFRQNKTIAAEMTVIRYCEKCLPACNNERLFCAFGAPASYPTGRVQGSRFLARDWNSNESISMDHDGIINRVLSKLLDFFGIAHLWKTTKFPISKVKRYSFVFCSLEF